MIGIELAERLYPCVVCTGWRPYKVYSLAGHTIHVPGLHGYQGDLTHLERTAELHGFRGIAVKDPDVPATAQPVNLCWAGIDIDAEDNGPGLIDRVVSTIGDDAIIRTSKSGEGVHALFVLANPVECQYEQAKHLAKQVVAPYCEKLKAAGIAKCVSGLPNLWLWSVGGKQRTVCDTGRCVPAPTNLPPMPKGQPNPWCDVFTVSLSSTTLRVVLALVERGILKERLSPKTQVNVGAVKRCLNEIGIDFPTRSKCRPEHAHNPNGFIELTPDGTIRLVSSPDDNETIFTLHSF